MENQKITIIRELEKKTLDFIIENIVYHYLHGKSIYINYDLNKANIGELKKEVSEAYLYLHKQGYILDCPNCEIFFFENEEDSIVQIRGRKRF